MNFTKRINISVSPLSLQTAMLSVQIPSSTRKFNTKLPSIKIRGWSGGAMVLSKLPVPGRPTVWMTVGN